MKDVTAALKDRAILFGWIAGLVLIASLIWSFSFPFRAACLMRGTNRMLILMNDSRRLEAPVLRPAALAGPPLMGCWYRLYGSNSLFFIFTVMKEGILIPCGAEISERGEVTEIIPLGSHARQVMDRIPAGQMQLYIHRIESAVPQGGGPNE